MNDAPDDAAPTDADKLKCAECGKFLPETIEEEEEINRLGAEARCASVFRPSCSDLYPGRFFLRRIHLETWEIWERCPPRSSEEDNNLCDLCFENLITQGIVGLVEGICVGCYEPDHDGIGCRICKARFRCMSTPKTNQGADCAASTFQQGTNWWLTAYYGSSFDCSLFRFVAPPEEVYQNADPICDLCITKLLEDGKIESHPGDFPFGATWAEDGKPVARSVSEFFENE